MGDNYLAFDLGAESGRAILGTLKDGRLTLTEKHRFTNPSGQMLGHFHWNLLGQWQELKAGLQKVAAEGIELASLGVDTWGVDFGLIGRDGSLLGLPYQYRDPHTTGMMDAVFARVPREEVFRTTGIQFMQINTLYHLMAMKQSNSPLLEMAESMLFTPDLFHYLFTGQRCNEFSIASTSQMCDARRRDWARPMLQELGIPTQMLGRIVPSGTVVGNVTAQVARECEARPIPVIAPGSHDTASAVAAVPARGQAWCYISSGTWSLMGVELSEPLINDASLKYNYTNEGGVAGTTRFLKNIMGMWLVQECRRHWARQGHDHDYAELVRLASDARPLVAMIDPDDTAFLTPGDMPAKIVQFCQKTHQQAPADKGEFVRMCLESLALTYRRTLLGLEEMLGRRIDAIHIVGGGTRNELLNQMTADCCNRQVITGPVEATAAGNVLVQAMAMGRLSSVADIRQVVRDSFEVKTYTPRNTAPWDDAYTGFRNIVEK